MELELIRKVEVVNLSMSPDESHATQDVMISHTSRQLPDESHGGAAVLFPSVRTQKIIFSTLVNYISYNHHNILRYVTYPNTVQPRRGPIPGIVVRHPAHPLPGHANDHVHAVHGVEVTGPVLGHSLWEVVTTLVCI